MSPDEAFYSPIWCAHPNRADHYKHFSWQTIMRPSMESLNKLPAKNRRPFPVASPPFPWAYSAQAQRQFDATLRKAETRLRFISAATCGPPAAWRLSELPWLTDVIRAVPCAAGDISQFRISDRVEIPAQNEFVDRLIAAASLTPGEQKRVINNMGRPLFRTAPIYSRVPGGGINMEFYSHVVIVQQLHVLLGHIAKGDGPPSLITIIGVFAHFIAIHPFQDGNGRAARYLLCQLLRKSGMWSSLPLPLGVLFSRDRHQGIAVLNSVTLERNWSEFVPYMLHWINASAELSILLAYISANAAGELFGETEQVPRTKAAVNDTAMTS